MVAVCQSSRGGRGEGATVQEALIGRAGHLELFDHPGSEAAFVTQFAERLKEIGVEIEDGKQATELSVGELGTVAIVADDAAHLGPDFLFGIRLIIFPIRPAAGQAHALVPTPRDENMIEKLPAVVGVEFAEGHGEPLADEMDGGADAAIAFAPDGLTVGPAGSDVDGDEGMRVWR